MPDALPAEDARRGWRSLVAGWRGTALAAGLVAVAVAVTLPTLFHYQGPPMEEGFMLVFPERVLAGDLPHRDFLHLYGPGSLWALAGWYRLVGTTLDAERAFGLAQHLGIIFGLFALALPWGRKVATACGLLGVLFTLTPIGLTALAWNGAVALAVGGCGLALSGAHRQEDGRPGRARLVGAGLLFGLALLFRPDLVVAVGLALLALTWRRWRRDLLVPLAAGIGLGAAPMVIHLVTVGPGTAFEGMFLEPVFDLRGGRTLPVPPTWDHLDSVLQALGQLDAPGWPLPMLQASHQVVLWFFALPLAALSIVVTGAVAMRRDPDALRSRILLVVGALGLGLLPQALQRPDTTHLAWVSCVSMVFLPVAVAQWGEWWIARRERAVAAGTTRRTRLHPAVVRTGAALLPLVIVVLVIPAYSARPWSELVRQAATGDYFGSGVRNGDRTFYLGTPELAANAQAVTDELAARIEPGDRLFVGTADLRKTPYSDAFFYFLFPEATPATRYIEMDPGIANGPDSGLAGEVAGADWLILSHAWDSWEEPNDSLLFGPDEPNQVVRDQFCRVGDQGPFYLLYRRC